MDLDTIIVVDYGSQYSQLIVRRVREANVFCRLVPCTSLPEEIESGAAKGIILSGGPNSVYDPGAPKLPNYVIESGLPVLGICYGMQLLVHHFGGVVSQGRNREYGPAVLAIGRFDSRLFSGWTNGEGDAGRIQGSDEGNLVWMSHGDLIAKLPQQFHSLASTQNSPVAAVQFENKPLYGVQFHPEVGHTKQGARLIENFVRNICACRPDWTPHNFVETTSGQMKEQIGDDKVLLALSGGVDSATAAVLLKIAVGKQLEAVFVDHGLMRKGESEEVIRVFGSELDINLTAVNAVEEFMEALEGVSDPESKRRIVGELFIRVFEREAKKLGDIKYLAQGTIYPDVIESASHDRPESETIKTHHNVGGLPDEMDFELVEPLRMLFKDEVRKAAAELNIPSSIIWRQPFPGPGLAIRCIGPVTWERLEKLREADAIFTQELARADMLADDTQQAFAVLLPIQSVGVMGDGRTYEDVIALRAVTTDDFMTADWARLPSDLLAKISNRIVNEVHGVNRVVYDVTSKPPATIEWE